MQEIIRVSAPNSVVLLSHMHNLNGKDPVPGQPLTADGWLGLSRFSHAKLLPEPRVFNDFLEEDKLGLLYEPSQQELGQANAFSLVATDRKKLFKVHHQIGEPFFALRNHPTVNQLFRISTQADKVLLQKNWPSAYVQAENARIDKFIPDKLFLGRGFLNEVSENKISEFNSREVADLMKKFILINTPQNYYLLNIFITEKKQSVIRTG